VVLLSTQLERDTAIMETSEELPAMPPIVRAVPSPADPVQSYRQALGNDLGENGLTEEDEVFHLGSSWSD